MQTMEPAEDQHACEVPVDNPSKTKFEQLRELFIYYCREEDRLVTVMQQLFPLHMEYERTVASGEMMPYYVVEMVEKTGESHSQYLQYKKMLEECRKWISDLNKEIVFMVRICGYAGVDLW